MRAGHRPPRGVALEVAAGEEVLGRAGVAEGDPVGVLQPGEGVGVGPLEQARQLHELVAGLIEGYISPDPQFDLSFRILVGAASGLVFWLLLVLGLPWVRR